MEAIVRTPLSEIRAREEAQSTRNTQLQSLGISLTQEKIKNIQKDAMIQALGRELAQLKIELTLMKGAAE